MTNLKKDFDMPFAAASALSRQFGKPASKAKAKAKANATA